MSLSNPDPGQAPLSGEALASEMLRAGAGRAEIEFPVSLFPTEGFDGVHDALHVRVLLLEKGIDKIGFVSIELTSVPEEVVKAFQKVVGEAAGMPPENILVCVTHTFSAPHFMPAHMLKTEAEHHRNDQLFEAIHAAVCTSVSQAISGMQAVRFGCETGSCDVNVNRDILTADGWWLGSNETGPSDKSVMVLRFESLHGDAVALLFSYSVQPSVMDAAQATGRLVTADMAGAASRFLEQEYGDGLTALFCLGAAADQAPSLKGAKYQYIGKDGHIRVENIDSQGFIIAEMLGKRLGVEVLQISEKIRCQALTGSILAKKDVVRCPGQKMLQDTHLIRPANQYTFAPADDHEEPVEIVRLGNVALVGVRPELCCMTAFNIKEQSPFRQTAVLTMVNGAAKYMPDLSAYDRITYEAMNSPFGRGSAEILTGRVVELLGG